MKHTLLSPLARFLAAALVFSAGPLAAQDSPKSDKPSEESTEEGDEEDEPGDEEEPAPEGEDPAEEMTPEEREERMKEYREMEKGIISKMMAVFKPLEGTWTGEEKLEYVDKSQKDKTWKDEWTGKFTFGGRYFEMDGQTEGDDPSAYRWICTFDPDVMGYRAWYFGDRSTTEYSGTLNKEKTAVIWKTETKLQTGTYTSEFTMVAKGHRVECSGADKVNGKTNTRQSSRYTRKRISL